ncbi:hypothetical protein ACW9H6_26060 [Pseudomonas sp. SDO528_S397]
MKDEFKLHLSREELQRAAQASRFSGADPGAVNVANVVFAAFVKRQQLTGKQPDFAGALSRTLTGETVQRCLQGMGVYGLAQRVPAQHLAGKGVAGVMETHTFGAAFVLDGVKHHYDERLRPDRSEGYRLFNDRRDLQPAPVPQKPGTPVGVKPANIWSGFYQGVEGNCVTVSAIKAAMMRFGQHPQGIYRQVTPTPQGFDVVMRDAFRLHVSRDELEQARAVSNFKGSDADLLDDANFLYAVSAKRAQLENNDHRGGQSYTVALQTLNDGEAPGESLRRLGLFAYIRESTDLELAQGAIGTLANYKHSVVVIDGMLDMYGQKLKLALSDWMRTGARALKLV